MMIHNARLIWLWDSDGIIGESLPELPELQCLESCRDT